MMSVAGPIKLQMKYVSKRNQHLKKEGETERVWETADELARKKKNIQKKSAVSGQFRWEFTSSQSGTCII